MNFATHLSPILEQYIESHSTSCNPILEELERETFRKTTHPHMISGFLQGRLLSFVSKIIQPKSILEIGTFTGYATLCLAEGLPIDGTIFTIDTNEELQAISEKYFQKSGYFHQIKYLHGDALHVIPTLEESFDLVFIDADKERYSDYFKLIKPKLNPKAIVITDNVLWYGKVAINENEDVQTQYLKDYNDLLFADQDMETFILPIRDGISLARKK